MTYLQAVQYLHDLDRKLKQPFHTAVDEHGIKIHGGIGLRRIQMMLDLVGHPEQGMPIINVAGTSGKGSVCKMLHCIYHEAGKIVGTFYSPALTTMIEQIELNGELIAPDTFASLVKRVQQFAEQVEQAGDMGPPSSFEILVLMALLYFKDKECEIVILESGLGGAYDACNIAEIQVAAVVTNVGLDHMEVLGDTVEAIARDKVGILKAQGRLFTRTSDQRVLTVLEAAAQNQDAIFLPVIDEPHIIREDLESTRFGLAGVTVDLPLGGRHQIDNAAIAYALTNLLAIDREMIERGLSHAQMPGRCEVVQRDPLVLLDGAHNPDKVLALVEHLQRHGIHDAHIVFGVLADKDVDSMLRRLQPVIKKLYVTQSKDAPRPVYAPDDLLRRATALGIEAQSYSDATEALERAMQHDKIVVTGSLHLVGELRKKWYSEAQILERRCMKW